MRRDLLLSSIILAAGIAVASLFHGGIYNVRIANPGLFLWRVNKITGATYLCSRVESSEIGSIKGCVRLEEHDFRDQADFARYFLENHPNLDAPSPTPTP